MMLNINESSKLALSLQQGAKVLHVCDCSAHDNGRLGYADKDSNREQTHYQVVQFPSTRCIKAVN